MHHQLKRLHSEHQNGVRNDQQEGNGGREGGTDKEQRHDKAFRSTRGADEKEGEPDTQYHTKSLELEG